MPAIPITRVRWDVEASHKLLYDYVFGGRMATRPPRGVNPAQVSDFIREELHTDSPPFAYRKAAELLRFYERFDVLDHIALILRAQESSEDDVLRSAYALQMFGDLASAEQAAQAAGYFDRVIVPHPYAVNRVSVLIETAVALIAESSVRAIDSRLTGDIQSAAARLGNSPGPEAATYLKLVDTQRIDLHRTRLFIDEKRRILAMPAEQRRRVAIWIYIGESDYGGPQMETWAARLIRREAMESNPDPVYADLALAIDSADPEQMGKSTAEFVVHRAAQAILYLHGKLSWPHANLYNQIDPGQENFLWDDLGAENYPA